MYDQVGTYHFTVSSSAPTTTWALHVVDYPSLTVTPVPTPTAYPSATATAVSTPTPVAPGPNIAGQATSFIAANLADAPKAVDGNTVTFWNAKAGPVQTLQLKFSSFHQVAGVELVPAIIDQSGNPLTGAVAEVVELWIWDGFNWNLADTLNESIADGQVLGIAASALPTATPTSTSTLTVSPTSTSTLTSTATPGPTNAWNTSAIFVRVLRGNNPVAWREIRVYEQLGPPPSPALKQALTPTPPISAPAGLTTPTPTRTVTAVALRPAFVIQPPQAAKAGVGLGLGPGAAPTGQPAGATPALPAPGTPAPGEQATGGKPLAFLLVLEIKSGDGYR